MYMDRIQDYKEALEFTKSKPEDWGITNEHQVEVFTNAYWAACSYVGGLENTMSDNEEDSDWYQNAEKALNNGPQIREVVYSDCMNGYYGAGIEGPANGIQKHMRFAGKAWTQQVIDKIVTRMGY